MNAGDATLWERWRQVRDADAFTELVSRHAGMVYATCRRVLSNATDAEDAAQECFIELMHARVSVAGSLGPWLHTVAVRRARDRVRSDTRRRRREERYADGMDSVAEPQTDELLELIDEAVFSLPPKLKAPVVSRFLEGCSLDAVAQALDLPESTVRYRIDRGVERIRAYLRRRGVAVGGVALAAFLQTNLAEAAPAPLVSVLGRLSLAGSAAPLPSAVGVAEIAGGLLVMKKAIAIVVVVLAAGVGIWKASHWQAKVAPAFQTETPKAEPAAPTKTAAVVQASRTETVQDKSEPAPAPAAPVDSESIPVLGHVVDRDGQPVAGAHVGAKTREKDVLEAVSGADGAFKFGIEFPSNEFYLQASKDDHVSAAMGPLKLRDVGYPDLVLRLDLPRTARVSGTLVNSQGKPVGDLKLYFDRGTARGLLKNETTRTGADGAFDMTNLAPGKCAIVPIPGDAGSGLLDAHLVALDLRAGEAVSGLRLVYDGLEGLALAGRVVNKKGEPISGAFVMTHGQHNRPALTNASGAFRIQGLAEGNTTLTAQYKGFGVGIVDNVKAGREDVEIVLSDMGTVTGRVTRQDTGAVVSDFDVFCAEGQASKEERMRFQDRRAVHNADGRLSLPLAPGDVGVTVRAKGLAPLTKIVKVNEGAETSCDFALKPGTRVEGQVVNRYGAPVSRALVFTGPLPLNAEDFRSYAARTDANGHFVVDNAEPGLKLLTLTHPDYAPASVDVSQAARIVMSNGCVLEGTVTENGVPRAGIALIVMASRAGATATPCRTDLDGGYRLEGLAEESVSIMVTSPVDGKRVIRSAVLSAEHPTRQDIAFNVGAGVIEGRVTADGEAVKGATIEVRSADDESGEPLTAMVGADGEFRIAKAPTGRLVLRVTAETTNKRVRIKTSELQLGDGETLRQDVDLGAKAGARVTGTLSGPGIGAGAMMQVILLPGTVTPPAVIDQSRGDLLVGYMRKAAAMAECTPDAAFELEGIGPGTYTVIAVTAPNAKAVDAIHLTAAELVVTSTAPQTVNLTVTDK